MKLGALPRDSRKLVVVRETKGAVVMVDQEILVDESLLIESDAVRINHLSNTTPQLIDFSALDGEDNGGGGDHVVKFLV